MNKRLAVIRISGVLIPSMNDDEMKRLEDLFVEVTERLIKELLDEKK